MSDGVMRARTSGTPPQQWQGVLAMVAPERWMQDALCAETDPEAFFPEKGGSARDAKKICNSCEVREQCLAYALGKEERFGIWGGLSERELRKLRRPRISPEQEKVLREMSERFATNREIAEVMGLSALTIGQYRRALRLPTVPAGRPSNGAVA
jgi:WhiB family transcriptional regulator, redox-sensing transcriptional regulator